MLKLRFLFAVMLILLGTSCSGGKATFYGKWINPNHRSESLTFHKDGTFTASSGREIYQGYWNIYDKGHITMTINSGADANIHTARYDAETGKLIITIAGNDIVMQRADK
jgi:hypothetical protein